MNSEMHTEQAPATTYGELPNRLLTAFEVAEFPRWTPENRPLIDTSKPATTGVATETADY